MRKYTVSCRDHRRAAKSVKISAMTDAEALEYLAHKGYTDCSIVSVEYVKVDDRTRAVPIIGPPEPDPSPALEPKRTSTTPGSPVASSVHDPRADVRLGSHPSRPSSASPSDAGPVARNRRSRVSVPRRSLAWTKRRSLQAWRWTLSLIRLAAIATARVLRAAWTKGVKPSATWARNTVALWVRRRPPDP